MIESSDLARVVDRVVEGVKIAALLERYPGGGSPAYHPRMMLKVLVYAYGTRVYSSRQIAKHLRRDMNFMWLAGRNTPDFRTINRFRGEYLQEAMAPIFAEVVGLLIKEGYVKGEEYFLDSPEFKQYRSRSCARCRFSSECTPNGGRRTLRRSEALEHFKEEARNNLTSPLGIELEL